MNEASAVSKSSSAETQSQRVFVLVISHRHGFNITVHASEDGARTELLDYVEREWDDEITSESIEESNGDETIERYFELVDTEGYTIESCEVAQ